MLCIEIPLFNSVIVIWNNSREIQTIIKLPIKIAKAIIRNSNKYFRVIDINENQNRQIIPEKANLPENVTNV